MELLKLLLPIVATVAVGIASAVFGQLLLTSRKLRSDLAVDSEMLERLPDDARRELKEEIRRRTYLLVAYTRYPALTRPEILALFAILLITAAGVALVWDEHRVDQAANANPLVVSGLLVALTVSYWVFYLHSWVPRTVDRLAYIQGRLGGEQAMESARVLRVALWVTMLGGLACLLIPPVDLLFVTEVYEFGEVSRGWAIVGVVALALAFVGLTAWRSQDLVHGSVPELLLRLYILEHPQASPDSDQEADRDPNEHPT